MFEPSAASVESSRGSGHGVVDVLVFHPNRADLARYTEAVKAAGHSVMSCQDSHQVLSLIYKHTPDLVVAEVGRGELGSQEFNGGMNGYQICRLVKNDPAIKDIPVILTASQPVSGTNSRVARYCGFKAGADEFLYDVDIAEVLPSRVNTLRTIYKHSTQKQHHVESLKETRQQASSEREHLVKILDRALVESTMMTEFRNLSDLILDKELLSYMLLSLLESLVEYDLAALFFNDPNREPRRVVFHQSSDVMSNDIASSSVLSAAQLEHLKESFFNPLLGEATLSRQFDVREFECLGALQHKALESVVELAPESAVVDASLLYQTAYFKPFYIGDDLVGALALYSKEPKAYASVFPVTLIENELRLLMKLRYLYARAETMAITDGLTGLFNFRHFSMTLEREFKRAKRYNKPLSLAFVDIDHFKHFNDQWGHLLGDEVLRRIAGCIEESVRIVDFVGRYGGEEMVVIFPETDSKSALVACERLRQRIETMSIVWDGAPLKVTASVGLAEITHEMMSASALIKLADARLYHAKQEGRNRVVLR